MNKAQAIFLLELNKMALKDSELMKEFKSRFGTYGETLAKEGMETLRESFQLKD